VRKRIDRKMAKEEIKVGDKIVMTRPINKCSGAIWEVVDVLENSNVKIKKWQKYNYQIRFIEERIFYRNWKKVEDECESSSEEDIVEEEEDIEEEIKITLNY
jgi:hypothetical protein